MNYSLKDVLKSLKVLFISKKENITKRELSILTMFFDKIIFANNSKKAFSLFSEEHPDVIISDIDLEFTNGIDLCKKIRKVNSSIPIIIISKQKEEHILFEVIRLQAIDFVVRPTRVEHLIFALNQTAKYIVKDGNITTKLKNGFIYDYKEKTILQNNNKSIKLTKNEFRLFELLLANKNKTLSKVEIESFLWANENITESAFKSLFSRLRQKIGKENIVNSFGIGYQLV